MIKRLIIIFPVISFLILATVYSLSRNSISLPIFYNSIQDEGVILEWGSDTLVLANLPSCSTVDDFYTTSQPTKKYVLIGEGTSLKNFIAQPVSVWGKVKKETKILKPPEIVCITSPCVAEIEERVMRVEKVELSDMELSSCQRGYLSNLKSQPQK